MARQHTISQTVKSIAGSALVGPGLFILFGNLDGAAAQLGHLLRCTPCDGLGLLSSVILAASFDHQRLLEGLVQMLVSFWPLLFVIGGAVLLRNAFTDRDKGVIGSQQTFPKKDSEAVDLIIPDSTSN
ncbi:MAG: hypothetical protein LAO56_08365 [Acidobacteriia bacterium]|nr:hypothetical protein [Terriglobia bacterium]